jgi:immune inhibitor A
MAWQYNKKVLATFTYSGQQWAWANIDTVGWRRIKDGAGDGVTNLHVLLNTACAHGRLVHVDIDAANLITTAYLI